MLDLIDNEDENADQGVEKSNGKIQKMSIKDDDAMDQNDDPEYDQEEGEEEEDKSLNTNKRKHDTKVNRIFLFIKLIFTKLIIFLLFLD